MGETLDGLLQTAQEALRMWTEDALAEEERLPAPRSLDEIARDPQVADALRHGAAFAIVPLLIETGRSVKANLSMGAWSLAAIDDAFASRPHQVGCFIKRCKGKNFSGGLSSTSALRSTFPCCHRDKHRH